MPDENQMTQESYDKLEAEHDQLVSVRRKEVSARLKEAISYGDLSENAEYDAAKNEQAELEERISTLENMMRNAVIVKDVSEDFVNVGVTVTVQPQKSKTKMQFAIVGTIEVDPFAEPPRISTESEVGRSLLGSKVGDEVEVNTPDGTVLYKVVDIAKTNK